MNRLWLAALILGSSLTVRGAGLVPTNPPPSVTLAWDAEAPANYIANYKVYYGPASATYTNSLSAGTNTTLTVSNLVRGATYYFAATATSTNGLESAFSSEVSATIPSPPPPPTTFTLIVN